MFNIFDIISTGPLLLYCVSFSFIFLTFIILSSNLCNPNKSKSIKLQIHKNHKITTNQKLENILIQKSKIQNPNFSINPKFVFIILYSLFPSVIFFVHHPKLGRPPPMRERHRRKEKEREIWVFFWWFQMLWCFHWIRHLLFC